MSFMNSSVEADVNSDGSVNLFDYTILGSCLAGPGGTLPVDCACADVDIDGDVDLGDFSAMQDEMTFE